MLNTKIEITVGRHTGSVAFYDDGRPDFKIDGQWSGVNSYDLEYYGRGASPVPAYLESLLATDKGDLITVIAQGIASNEVQKQIKAEIAGRQQAIAPTETWVPAISIADGWDLTLGCAKHSDDSIWLFDTHQRFEGAAEQAIKALIRGWDLPRVSGTQSGVVQICTEAQLEQIKAVAETAKLADTKEKLKTEILETEATIKSFGNPQKLPTKADAIASRNAYNNLMNEGGNGYLPPFPCEEEYRYHKEKLEKLLKKYDALQS
jgi:hypothetical protein